MNGMSAAFGVARRGRPALMFGAVLLAVAVLHFTPLRERLDGTALDLTQRVVRAVAPRPAVEEVIVIVGIDEETERRFPEPFALWHKRLGEALEAIALGNPRLVALDIALPERSYDSLVPGLDAELIRGLVAAKHPDRLVIGLRLNARGKPQKIDNLLLAVVGADAVGLAYVIVDRDGTARRFEPLRGKDATTLPLLAERIGMKLGIEQRAGIVDFAAGKVLDYVPLHDVVAWARERPEALAQAFAGKVVLVGKVGPDEDAVRQPLSIASWAPGASAPPGVVLLAQTVRAMQSGRIVTELAWPALGALVAICAAVVLVGGGVRRTWTVAALLLAGVLLLVYFAYLAGVFVPPTAAIAAVLLGATVRTSADAVEHRRFRLAIEGQFAGYVSQNLLDAIVAGNVDPRQPRRYTGLGFLFADLRGFTTLTERIPAEEALALLNRYYEAITPAIHQFQGTIDNFRGDGILAIFGAPVTAPDGPRQAVLAAREMFVRLAVLNQTLAAEGREPLEMGIGLSAGDAVAGNVGTASRYGYSAIGDAVNVSARLQSLCKPRGMRIVASEPVARACWEELPFVALGRVELAGHAPVEAFGVPKSSDKLPDEMREKSLGPADFYA